MFASANPAWAKTSRAASSSVAGVAGARPPVRLGADWVGGTAQLCHVRANLASPVGGRKPRGAVAALSPLDVMASAAEPSARLLFMPTYTLREAADLLGVSVDTARRWAESGRLSSHADA